MPKKTISKDLPLAELILRRYEKPYQMNDRDLVRKLCLSIGLLQPGDSRDVIVEVLQVLLNAKKKKKLLNSKEITENVIILRKKNKLQLRGVASSNVRRQLKRLRDLMLIEKIQNSYRVTEFNNLAEIFNEKIKKYYLDNIINRVEEYFKAIK